MKRGAVGRKILLTGKNGQVGWELQRALAPLGEVVAVDRRILDLASADSIRAVIREVKPQLIVNPAAYTAVDQAENESALAQAVNAVAPGVMAEEAKRLGAALVHYSTDYVFDGSKTAPYTEDDAPNPLNAYGRTKLAGEQAIQAVGGQHLILRTSWVYGLRGRNFLKTILRLAKEREELKIVDDQLGAPTWSRLLAEATAQILARQDADMPGSGGLYHLAAGGVTSWYGFARAILDEQGRLAGGAVSRLTPIPTADYPLPAMRPAYSVMSSDKLRHAYAVALPSWDHGLRLCMEDMFVSAG